MRQVYRVLGKRTSLAALVAMLAIVGCFPLQATRFVPAYDGVAAVQSSTPLTMKQASAFARLALKGLNKEYPNKPGHVLNNASDIKGPRELFPAFYGCFDWHSSVHGHWMLVRLLRLFPDL